MEGGQVLTAHICRSWHALFLWFEFEAAACLSACLPYSASKLCCLPTHTQVAAAMCTPHHILIASLHVHGPGATLSPCSGASCIRWRGDQVLCGVAQVPSSRPGGLAANVGTPAKSCGKQEGSVIRAQLLTVRVTSWSRLAPSQGWTLPMAWLPVDWVEEVEEEEEEVEEAKMQSKIYLGGGILHKLEQVAKCGTGYL